MNLTAYILDQALKQLRVPAPSRDQFHIASALSDVGGQGFPKELFALSAPVILRGLLNYAILQMKRDWVFPYWVHRQLDPADVSFQPRAQNPLLVNATHRNWTLIGSPHGRHEAIVDPRGLVTPLPREWSLDHWLVVGDRVFYPSLMASVEQSLDSERPAVHTSFECGPVSLTLFSFVEPTQRSLDVLFTEARVHNRADQEVRGTVFVAIRPFNPEGISPIRNVAFPTRRHIDVNGTLAVVFAQDPHWTAVGDEREDLADRIRRVIESTGRWEPFDAPSETRCKTGLGHAIAAFDFVLSPGSQHSIHSSIALGHEQALRSLPARRQWRISFDRRNQEHVRRWRTERSFGGSIRLPDASVQRLLDSSVLALLQLHDHDFVSPGPWIYHQFWFRDAAPLLEALDCLSYHKRVRETIGKFTSYQTGEGFFRGPEGEWDSNGEAIWLVVRHAVRTQSSLWLRSMYSSLRAGAEWIIRKRGETDRTRPSQPGLLPPSLSAEHLGTVDQYYWDSLWGLAGLESMATAAGILGKALDAERFRKQAQSFAAEIDRSLAMVVDRIGAELIPATPTRSFDESAIGSLCAAYPLDLASIRQSAVRGTTRALAERFVDGHGFYHPFIHSGYNVYLTLQIAHALLWEGERDAAWRIAQNVFSLAMPTGTFPEAVHPRTFGGAMGDGHHGWAAAEVVLFIRDALIDDRTSSLRLLGGIPGTWQIEQTGLLFRGLATRFGPCSFELKNEGLNRATLNITLSLNESLQPQAIVIDLPFEAVRVVSGKSGQLRGFRNADGRTLVECAPATAQLLVEW